MPLILAIESSCDDTSIAILRDNVLVCNVIYGQNIHEEYGGVIPEEASRQHMQNIMPVLKSALQKAAISLNEINAIAVTQAPGLLGSLMVGFSFAKSLSYALNIPLIGVNHIQAHVVSCLLGASKPKFPFLCLTVSGGHTQIVQCNNPLNQIVLGVSIDDAAGEAFDKSAKLLGLPYPGGPLIDQYAQLGNPKAFEFAQPNITDLNFSFSGLKTSILYFLQKKVKENEHFIKENLADLCASIQYTIFQILIKKLNKAVIQTGIKQVCIAGGVSANSGLRETLLEYAQKYKWDTYIPEMQFCTDNAAMIALLAYYKFLNNDIENLEAIPLARTPK